MKVYTSYWGNLKKLARANIEPVAICRGKPKNWAGRAYDSLAPTWAMLNMDEEDYDACYSRILARNDQREFMRWLESGMRSGCEGVAIMCWEKDPNQCHRSKVARWLKEAGYECREFDGVRPEKRGASLFPQMTLF